MESQRFNIADQEFQSKIEDLLLLGKSHTTCDMFISLYEKMLKDLQDKMRALHAVALLQAAWLQLEKEKAQAQEGPVQ